MEDDLCAKTWGANDAKGKILDFEFVFAIRVFVHDLLRRRRPLTSFRVGW